MTSRLALMLCLTVTVLFAGLAYAADFSATPLAGTAPLTVRFTDLSTDSPTQWNWTFGDGARSTEGNPIHTYAGPGHYSVTLQTDTSGGRYFTKADFITVAKPGHWVSVTATSSSYVVDPNSYVTLTATAKDSRGHRVRSWSWSDGGKGGKFMRPVSQTTSYKVPQGAAGPLALKVTATCSGSPGATGTGAALLFVRAQGMYQPGDVAELSRVDVSAPYLVAVNSVDGSCWVGTLATQDQGAEVIHFAADGSELWRSGAFNGPRRLDVSSADGSCWIADTYPGARTNPNQEILVHLAADGTELWRGGDFIRSCPIGATCLKVNPADGSCWMTACGDFDYFLHVAQDGSPLPLLAYTGNYLSVDPADGSYWVSGGKQVTHFSPTGEQWWQGGNFGNLGGPGNLGAFMLNPLDGSFYGVDLSCCGSQNLIPSQIVRMDAQGNEALARGWLLRSLLSGRQSAGRFLLGVRRRVGCRSPREVSAFSTRRATSCGEEATSSIPRS